jgi:anti-sigma regulatory factor (Ser/Thr protein kinase)
VSLLHLDLPAEPDSVSQARDALDSLSARVGPDVMVDLRLLVSETVTNAVRHTGVDEHSRVVVVAEEVPGAVRIEVHDGGPGFAAPPDPGPRPEGTSGWGLFLVKKLSRRWGAEPAPDAHVWFELATS